jgi:HEPN domain-containing protein
MIEEMEKCLNQDSLILAEARQITREKFEESCMFWIDQGLVREMFAIQASIHQKIK